MDSDFINSYKELIKEIKCFDISSTPEDEVGLLQSLNNFSFHMFGFSKIVPKLERLTINKTLPNNCNDTIKEIKYLKNPPKELVTKYNRANLKNQSILYATLHLPTALNENNPDIGDLVTISKWELIINDLPLIVYPAFDFNDSHDLQLKNEFYKAIKHYPEELRESIIIDNCVVASYFSKYVEKGKEINYTLSAHIADRIFKNVDNGNQIEAIIYPSVKDSTRTNNLAIRPEIFNEKYKLMEVIESIVISKLNGSIFLKTIKRTTNFKNNLIKWN
jgi:hypothetical protein